MEYKIYILVVIYHLSLSNITFISISNFSSFENKKKTNNQYPCKSYLDKDSFLSHINLSRLHATISSVTMEIVMKAISTFASPWKVNWEKLNLTFLKKKIQWKITEYVSNLTDNHLQKGKNIQNKHDSPAISPLICLQSSYWVRNRFKFEWRWTEITWQSN